MHNASFLALCCVGSIESRQKPLLAVKIHPSVSGRDRLPDPASERRLGDDTMTDVKLLFLGCSHLRTNTYFKHEQKMAPEGVN